MLQRCKTSTTNQSIKGTLQYLSLILQFATQVTWSINQSYRSWSASSHCSNYSNYSRPSSKLPVQWLLAAICNVVTVNPCPPVNCARAQFDLEGQLNDLPLRGQFGMRSFKVVNLYTVVQDVRSRAEVCVWGGGECQSCTQPSLFNKMLIFKTHLKCVNVDEYYLVGRRGVDGK